MHLLLTFLVIIRHPVHKSAPVLNIPVVNSMNDLANPLNELLNSMKDFANLFWWFLDWWGVVKICWEFFSRDMSS